MLSPATMSDMERDYEPELNVQNKESAQTAAPTDAGNPTTSNDSKDSENAPLFSRIPGKIVPSKQEITFGDETSTIVYSKRQLARKTFARKTLEPRGTLLPQ